MFNKLFLYIIYIFLLLTPSIHSEVKPATPQPTAFASKDAGFSIVFSEGWEIMNSVAGTDVIALAPKSNPEDLFRANINIIHAVLDAPIAKEEYYSLNINSLNQLLEDFDLEKEDDVKIDGVDAKKLVFTHTIGVVNAKVIQYLFMKGNNAYVVTFTADPFEFTKLEKPFDEMIGSFKFLK